MRLMARLRRLHVASTWLLLYIDSKFHVRTTEQQNPSATPLNKALFVLLSLSSNK